MISIYPDLESLSHAAAGYFAEQVYKAVNVHSRFSVALSGGSTPRRTYELLASLPYRDQIPWEQVNIFWGDERCVPLDDPRSNARMIYEVLLEKVPIPADQIHTIPCAEHPARAVKEYDSLLKGFFEDQPPRFDLVLLGLGEDGHTASLFPGIDVLGERDRWVAEVYVSGQNFSRVTLTLPVINNAAAIAFLVSGASKAQIFYEILEGSLGQELLPAQLVNPLRGEVIWLVDQEAASRLQDRLRGH